MDDLNELRLTITLNNQDITVKRENDIEFEGKITCRFEELGLSDCESFRTLA